jgi:hypothetical protein
MYRQDEPDETTDRCAASAAVVRPSTQNRIANLGNFLTQGPWGCAFPLNMRIVTWAWAASITSITATSRMVGQGIGTAQPHALRTRPVKASAGLAALEGAEVRLKLKGGATEFCLRCARASTRVQRAARPWAHCTAVSSAKCGAAAKVQRRCQMNRARHPATSLLTPFSPPRSQR